MGIESFGIKMRAQRHSPIAAIDHAIRSLPFVRFVRADVVGIAYEHFDQRHLIEMLLTGYDAEAEFDLSVRFALCNPDAVQRPFIEFVRWAIAQWQPSTVWLLTSRFRKTPLLPPDYDSFLTRDGCADIQALRESWQARFGGKRGPVRVADAYSFAGVTNAT